MRVPQPPAGIGRRHPCGRGRPDRTNRAAQVLTAAITVCVIRAPRGTAGGACLYEAACQVPWLIATSQHSCKHTSSERAAPSTSQGARANGYGLPIRHLTCSQAQSLASSSEVSHPSIRALVWRVAPAHHTGYEWRSGAPCDTALTCGQGMHTRSLLQLDDQAVSSFRGYAATVARSRGRRCATRSGV